MNQTLKNVQIPFKIEEFQLKIAEFEPKMLLKTLLLAFFVYFQSKCVQNIDSSSPSIPLEKSIKRISCGHRYLNQTLSIAMIGDHLFQLYYDQQNLWIIVYVNHTFEHRQIQSRKADNDQKSAISLELRNGYLFEFEHFATETITRKLTKLFHTDVIDIHDTPLINYDYNTLKIRISIVMNYATDNGYKFYAYISFNDIYYKFFYYETLRNDHEFVKQYQSPDAEKFILISTNDGNFYQIEFNSRTMRLATYELSSIVDDTYSFRNDLKIIYLQKFRAELNENFALRPQKRHRRHCSPGIHDQIDHDHIRFHYDDFYRRDMIEHQQLLFMKFDWKYGFVLPQFKGDNHDRSLILVSTNSKQTVMMINDRLLNETNEQWKFYYCHYDFNAFFNIDNDNCTDDNHDEQERNQKLMKYFSIFNAGIIKDLILIVTTLNLTMLMAFLLHLKFGRRQTTRKYRNSRSILLNSSNFH